jgi:hypothetical protein
VVIERIQDQKTVHDGFYVELGRTQGAIRILVVVKISNNPN